MDFRYRLEIMVKENKLTVALRQFWQVLTEANEELNGFLGGGVPLATEKRMKTFLRRWDTLKEKADVLYDAIEQHSGLSVDPVEVTLPWNDDTFATAWSEWKDYLAEQHGKRMKSRMERAALEHLKELSDGDETLALQYLRFAMATGYQRFFKVTAKNNELPVAGGRGDGDF